MMLYDSIGKHYSRTRKSDSRIVAALLDILETSKPRPIVDIGAGTGSYALALAYKGYRVFAVEPSAVMRQQAIIHTGIQWIDGHAEKLPLPDRSADAAIIILAFHHFQYPKQALREVHRVTGGGQIILFTYDPDMISRFWLTKYFPSFISDVQSTFIPLPQLISEIQTIAGGIVKSLVFPLPCDLSDSFAAVGWAKPELYLDSNIRNGISSFAKLDNSELNDGITRLQEDLKTGMWEREYGHLRH
ncbi:MAG: class I SAM-dependent methyltransferase, partial [Cyanobacteriota bacterium]